MRLKLDQNALALSSRLERIAGVQVKDSFMDEEEETIYFIVAPGELGKAIGKGGMNIKRLSEELGKRIRITEYRDNVLEFVRGFIYPAAVAEVVQEGSDILIRDESRKTKSLLIGRGGKNIKLLNRAVKRFFSINEVKVLDLH
ncbi:NusA-like transcription termination signal-binding factor [Candidatus Woesearchaeota archaeon]|nr:NusA-like transcription termination signal-binding factor [Candidatus Woesearchaeota archaeon]